MDYKRYRFVKDFTYNGETIKSGSEVTVYGDRVWFDGGMVDPYYRELLLDLIEYEINEGFSYLKPIPIPYNKV